VDYLVFSPTLKNILLFFNYKNIEKKERKKERKRERKRLLNYVNIEDDEYCTRRK